MGFTFLLGVFAIDAVVDDKTRFFYLGLSLFVERTPAVECLVEIILIVSEDVVQPMLGEPDGLFCFHPVFQEGIIHDSFENRLDLLLTFWSKLQGNTNLIL